MASIVTVTLYHFKEEGSGVMAQISQKYEIMKETRMKSILISGAEGESKVIVPDMLKEMVRCVRLGQKKFASIHSENRSEHEAEQAQREEET